MAGKKRKQGQRDTSDIASPSAAPSGPATVNQRPYGRRFTEIEDRRHFHPDHHRVVRSTTGAPAPLRTREKFKTDTRDTRRSRSRFRPARWGDAVLTSPLHRALRVFSNPRAVLTCVRRQRRKEVLFALKQTGKGSRAKKRNRNERSYYSCSTR